MRTVLVLVLLGFVCSADEVAFGQTYESEKFMIAQGKQDSEQKPEAKDQQAKNGASNGEEKAEKKEVSPAEKEKKEVSPEEKMRRRFPQRVRVGDLIGLPVLDAARSTIGHVQHVTRISEGKIALIVSYGGLFGWGRRLVTVPIEVVVMAGRQIGAADLSKEKFEIAPTWYGSTAPLGLNESILIAIGKI